MKNNGIIMPPLDTKKLQHKPASNGRAPDLPPIANNYSTASTMGASKKKKKKRRIRKHAGSSSSLGSIKSNNDNTILANEQDVS